MRTIPPALFFPLLAPWRDSGLLLGRDGSLTSVIRLEGRDPDGLSEADFIGTTLLQRAALVALPKNIRLQQIYLHTTSTVPTSKRRGHEVIDELSAARDAHLSSKTLYSTRLYFALTWQSSALASRVGPVELVTLLMSAMVDPQARHRLRRLVSRNADLAFMTGVLDDAARQLGDAVDGFRRRASLYGEVARASVEECWSLARYLATYDEKVWDRSEPAPHDHWYAHLLHGRAFGCQVAGTEYLKLEEPLRYVRACSVVRYMDSVQPGFWARNYPAVLSSPGSFAVVMTAVPLDGVARSMRFAGLRNELRRQDLDLMRAMMDRSDKTKDARVLTDEEKEITAAERMDETWYDCQIAAFAVGVDAEAAKLTAQNLDHALTQARLLPVWETPGLEGTYRASQLGGVPFKPRALLLNATQLGASGLHYRYSQGVSRVEDLGGEEPLIWLETVDGQPFGFSPFVGQKSTVLGLGSSRSGKTFAKNILAAAWPKWGGNVVTFDYDMGSDCLAELYGTDAAAFANNGMNPFRAAGSDANAFKAHLSRLTLAMMASNDDASLRSLAPGEQRLLDEATDNVLALPAAMQTLSVWAMHLPPDTRQKLQRWVREEKGRYADYLDNEFDDVGEIERMMTVFNARHLRDDPAAKGPVIGELLWRVSGAFEDPSRIRVPKKLIFDEAHYVLRDRMLAETIVTKARTWAKYRASVELWTHIPQNYAAIEDWAALRSSASTFLFTATPDADLESYRSVFGLTAGDVETIRGLVPKRHLYLVQPDTGLRKQLVLDPDPASLVWASSSPDMVAKRAELTAQHGYRAAIAALANTKESTR